MPVQKNNIEQNSIDFRVLARSLTIVENNLEGAGNILKSLEFGSAPVIGITGPPGAGKSTLVGRTDKQAVKK